MHSSQARCAGGAPTLRLSTGLARLLQAPHAEKSSRDAGRSPRTRYPEPRIDIDRTLTWSAHADLCLFSVLACGHPSASAVRAPAGSSLPPLPAPTEDREQPGAWPDGLAETLSTHGQRHAMALELPRDAQGRERWLAFVGSPDVALGAWHVTRSADGTSEASPIEHFPVGVRVIAGLVADGVAYVLLESVAVLDQPAGMRSVWTDAIAGTSPFEASPMELSDIGDSSALMQRVKDARTQTHQNELRPRCWPSCAPRAPRLPPSSEACLR